MGARHSKWGRGTVSKGGGETQKVGGGHRKWGGRAH